jgi:NADH:ubiquinone reductase (H+-translocating)
METIVIVGGGAGGLELAAKLGRLLGPKVVTLVDCRPFHVWKPSLHEVAAGTLDIHAEGLSYQMLARDNGFAFVFGAMTGLNANARQIEIGEILDDEGSLLVPARTLSYGRLVLAIGSESNFFGIPGAEAYCVSLNGTDDAERFRLRMLKLLISAQAKTGAEDAHRSVHIVIVGGGATGVELAAELREASSAYADYRMVGLDQPIEVRITLLEGDSRILAPLPAPVSDAAAKLLAGRGVTVVCDCKVAKVEPGAVYDSTGAIYQADLCVWAAGIKAPRMLKGLGLPINRLDQLEVDTTLKVSGSSDIYAMGDCAFCVMQNGRAVPPRAQAAHQEAAYLARRLLADVRGGRLSQTTYVYSDHGSLVSIGRASTVGSLMGVLGGAGFFVEGLFARLMYVSLHLMHHQAVVGLVRTAVLALTRFLRRRTAPHVKLH